jgi:membrane protein
MVMFLIAYNHYYNKPPWTDESLASYLGVSVEAVQVALDGLSDTGFVLQVQAEPTAYVPARDIETVTLKALRDGMREAGSTHQRAASMLCSVPAVNDVLKRIDVAVADALADQTIKTLVREHGKVLHTASSLSADTAASKRQTA